jgi:hypothetical protein
LLFVLVAGLCYGLVVEHLAVSRALSGQIQRGPGTTVDFAEVAHFAWDRVYVFGPYTPHERIHASLGFHWEGVRDTTVGWNDGVNLVVFIQGAEVVYWFEHGRKEELGLLANPEGYAREQARFAVCRDGSEQRLALTSQRR